MKDYVSEEKARKAIRHRQSPIKPEPQTLGRCKVCRKPRVVNMQKKVPPRYYLDDKFCSRVCAEKWWRKSEGAAHE